MTRFLKGIVGVALALVWGLSAVQFLVPGGVNAVITGLARPAEIEILDENIPLAGPSADGRTENGWLQVKDGVLANEAGEPFQLRGMSSHGIAWFPQYTSTAAIATTKSHGANLFRVAMYVDNEPGNYTTNVKDQQTNTDAMITAIENALKLDMYVIADWHIMEEGNPMSRVEDAVQFFDELSARYAEEPGVIYEICNEPNDGATWADITAYADQVIPAIQANAPNALILVGTPEYASDLMAAVREPLPYENIMYTYHYYTSTTDKSYRVVIKQALDDKIPVFVSEWGMGGGDLPVTEDVEQKTAEFLAFIEENQLSWANWSLSNKDESYSALRPKVSALSGWTDEDLTASGKLVFNALSK